MAVLTRIRSNIKRVFSNRTNGETVKDIDVKQFVENLRKYLKKQGKYSAFGELIPWQLYRYIWTIENWRSAIDEAENIHTPNKFDLIEIFHDIIDDYSVYSAMQQRTSKVINSKLMFLNDDGTENEDIKAFFLNADGTQKPWFRRWLKIAEDVKYYGFEVAELGMFSDGEFKSVGIYKSVSKIPEENLLPTLRAIKRDANAGISENNLISMDFGDYAPFLIPMGNEKDLGLLSKAVPYVIWKYIFGNWRQHAEIFGQPFREGRTDIYDNERVKSMQQMFEQMVSSAYGIFHPDDEIKFIETTKTDAYNIYDRLIARCDYAITKLFLSQTGTTDEKAFVGSAETHERVMKDLVMSDRLDISEYFTEILLPKLKNLGYIDSSVNVSLTWVIDEHVTLTEWAEIISKLSISYDIPAEEIAKRFDLQADNKSFDTIVENEKAAAKMADIMAKTQRYYQKLWRGQ